ncbi:MAG: hypothetical protein SF070_13720 [Gemmatimonadota bacterium]|nr:hypothetical protein [Gemmatimonadota bacterium]
MSDDRLRRSYDMLLAIRADTGDDRGGCPPVERIAGLIRREEDEDSRLALLDHVMACPFCQPEFELLRVAERASGEQARTTDP